MSTNKRGFNTRLLHVPFARKDVHGALQMPVYANSAFEFESAEDIEGAFNGSKPAHAYSRSGNPTVENLELRVKAITGATGVVACASGMAAITNTILTLCNSGDNVITSMKLFGNTYALFETTLKNFGINFKYCDFTDISTIEPLIDNHTKLIFLEIISNPFLEVIDIKKVKKIAHKNNLVLCADTTLTPPNIFDAGKYGIDISIISSTKYISSGGASIGGLIVDHGSFDWKNIPKLKASIESYGEMTFLTKLRREYLRNTGNYMSPFNAYLQVLGLETLTLRFDKIASNAYEIAKWLALSKTFVSVNYPGMENSPFNKLCKDQFSGLPGGILTFDLSAREDCFLFINKLKLVKRATNINDNKTLIIHPASTIYCEYSKEILSQMGIRDTMIRLSVGIEDVEDIIADLGQAVK
jgi:O-acetylhomoserine (thiol)-lyase